MSQMLSLVLGAREPDFSLMIRRLEQASGRPDADINLASELVAKTRLKCRELGLDPNDTNGGELYHALLRLTALHDEHLRKILGIKDSFDTNNLMKRVKSTVEKLNVPRKTWAVKTAVVKRLLSNRPPKNMMKLLGYRSVDSMLKREKMAEIYPAAQFTESPLWLKRFTAELKKLKPHDFETRTVEIIVLDPRTWANPTLKFITANRHNVYVSFELGAILLLPVPKTAARGLTIAILPLVLELISEIRQRSAYFKLRQVRSDFGRTVAAVNQRSPLVARLDSLELPWRTVHRYLAGKPAKDFADVLEPHLQPEDLLTTKAEEALFNLEPSLAFWRGLNYVGAKASPRPVSFNILDMAGNYVNDLPYGQQLSGHLKKSLWDELLSRYLSQPNLESDVLRQMDTSVTNYSKLNLGRLSGAVV